MYQKKVGFLKGLASGLELDSDSKEGRLFAAIIEVLDAMCETIEELEEEIECLQESLEEIEDNMEDYSEIFEALEDAAEEGGVLRRFPGFADGDADDDDDDDDDAEYEITCPGCEEEFVVSEETIMAGSVICPGCKQKITFDLQSDCGCGCHKDGCGHHNDEDKDKKD